MPVARYERALDAQDVERNYVIDERGRERAFSRAVSTIGGEIVWLAGQTATVDSSGTSLIGDFEAQTREIFRILDERLAGFGGSLDDIVTMTVFISDTRFGDEFVEIRKQHFDNDRFPSSALVTVVGFARPETFARRFRARFGVSARDYRGYQIQIWSELGLDAGRDPLGPPGDITVNHLAESRIEVRRSLGEDEGFCFDSTSPRTPSSNSLRRSSAFCSDSF